MKNSYKVLLLTGPLKGHEIPLFEGLTTFGLDNCDIMTPLDTPQATLELEANDRGVWLKSTLPVWTEGVKHRPDGQPLPLNKVIDIDGLVLVLAQMDTSLNIRKVPRRRKLSRGMIMVGLAVMLSGVSLVIGATGNLTSPVAPPLSSPEWLAQQHKKDEYKTLLMYWRDEQHLEVSGSCPTQKALITLQQQLAHRGVKMENVATCDDQILSNVRYALEQFGYQKSTVTMGHKHGEVIIRGQIKADESWQQVLMLLEKIKGLDHWQVIDKSDEQMKSLIEVLKKKSLLSKLSVIRRDEKIIISGKLSDAKTQELMFVLRDFMSKWPNTGEVVLQEIEASNSYKTFFPASIIGVGGNKNAAYIELSNGMRFSPGALLPSGYLIENIDSYEGIELSFEGQLFHVPLVIS